jgi:hypothetical protein
MLSGYGRRVVGRVEAEVPLTRNESRAKNERV